MCTHNIPFSLIKKNYIVPTLQLYDFFQGTPKRVKKKTDVVNEPSVWVVGWCDGAG